MKMIDINTINNKTGLQPVSRTCGSISWVFSAGKKIELMNNNDNESQLYSFPLVASYFYHQDLSVYSLLL